MNHAHARRPSSTAARTGRVLALLALAGVAWASWAQPPRPPRDEPAEARRAAPLDREAVKSRLTRRLNDTRSMLSRLEAAVEKLDAGVPLADVMGELAMDAPPFGRPEGQGPGARRPRMGDPEHEARPPGPGGQDPASRAARVREFVKRHLPMLAAEFDPGGEPAGERLVGWLAPQIAELDSARQRDEDLFQARLDEIRGAVAVGRDLRELRHAAARPGATPESLREHLDAIRASLGAQFDARLRAQRREIELLLGRVERLKADADRLESERETHLDDRMAELETMTRRRRDEPRPQDRP
ncbi:MAG: hypothetical protein FJ255_02565 [Phycisphaerae bacterium]|nr:hypothetical protein [Phycisphaerae bacterium]